MVNDKKISNDGSNNKSAIGNDNTFMDVHIHSSEEIKKSVMFELC